MSKITGFLEHHFVGQVANLRPIVNRPSADPGNPPALRLTRVGNQHG
jgi:hypothetical protein